jgi:hypothetical protein
MVSSQHVFCAARLPEVVSSDGDGHLRLAGLEQLPGIVRNRAVDEVEQGVDRNCAFDRGSDSTCSAAALSASLVNRGPPKRGDSRRLIGP